MDFQLGKIFRMLRLEKSLSLNEAAGQVLSRSQLSRFERGESELTANKLFLLLKNIGISLVDYVKMVQEYQIDNDNLIFQQAAILEKQGKIDELEDFFQKLKFNYRKSGNRHDRLHMLAIKSLLTAHGRSKQLLPVEIEFLEEYFFNIEVWGRTSIRFFLLTLIQFDVKTILFYTNNILSQEKFYETDRENQELIIMLLRNVISVLTEKGNFKMSQEYFYKLEKLSKIFGGLEVGILIQTLQINIYEKTRQIDKAKDLLRSIISTYEVFSNPQSATPYKKELEELEK